MAATKAGTQGAQLTFQKAGSTTALQKGHKAAKLVFFRKMSFKEAFALAQRERALSTKKSGNSFTMPFRTKMSPAEYAAAKLAARHNTLAPTGHPINPRFASRPDIGLSSVNFEGMADSSFICQPFGCQPPDMALAAAPGNVVQAINTSVAVYNPTTQVTELGWPLPFNDFFAGLPGAVASCDPFGPFLSDTSAFYDPVRGRVWVSISQFDGPFIGDPSCPDFSFTWYAVSLDSNLNDGWYIYGFENDLGQTEFTDYPHLGYDDSQGTIETTYNDFNFSTGFFDWAEAFYADKVAMEAGNPFPSTATYFGFNCFGGPCGTGFFLDTINPADMKTYSGPDPSAILNTTAFNFSNGGNGFCGSPNPCDNVFIFAFSNPLGFPSAAFNIDTLSNSWVFPPAADVPTFGGPCLFCVETLDNRISAKPIYSPKRKSLTYALETGAFNGTQVVPAVLYDNVSVNYNPTLVTMSTTDLGEALIVGSGDTAFSFGTTYQKRNGDIFLLTDTMSGTTYPGAVYQKDANADPRGFFEPQKTFKNGTGPDIFDARWGDYEAASEDGVNVWMASQFINGSGDWDTWMGIVF